MKNGFDFENPADSAWALFEKTGNISYYLLYKKLTEKYPFLHENDTLTEEFILKLPEDQQEICNALNRRTEFKVLRTTYGLFDEMGNLLKDALTGKESEKKEE